MTRLMSANLLPKSADRWLALVAGGGMLAATTAVTVAAIPYLPAATAFAVGVGMGVAWLTLAGVLTTAFRRPAPATAV